MKEELTEKMHSEFTISEETAKKHKIWLAIDDYLNYNTPIKEAIACYQGEITIQDIIDYLPTYNKEFGENVVIS